MALTLTTLHQSTATSTWWYGPRLRLGWVEMAVGFPRVPVTPGTTLAQDIFSPCCHLDNRRRAAHSFFKTGRLSSHFSYFSLRLLILLFFLMSGNVHSNPGSIFPCSVCAGNMTWWDRLVQCCTWSKWVHSKCSLLSFSKFRTFGSTLLELPLLLLEETL